MRIAIIGAGNVGGTLGRRWAECGHEIVFAVRAPGSEKIRNLLEEITGTASATSVAEASSGADVLVLATPWEAAADSLSAAGDMTGKLIVDCTNPLRRDLSGLSVGPDTSAGEEVARMAAGAKVVKAFNTTGSDNMADPSYGGEAITMFLCGDDADAKRMVAGLAQEIGFDAVDVGELAAARHLEHMALLWVHMAYNVGFGPDFAFKVVKR